MIGSEIKDTHNIIGASHKAEERREPRQAHAHQLKHIVEEQRYGDIKHVGHEGDGVICNKSGPTNEDLGGYGRQKVKQIDSAGNPGPETRRSFCNPFRHVSHLTSLACRS